MIKPLSAEDIAQLERLTAVANGTAPRHYWTADDETRLDGPPPLSRADAAEADRLAALAKGLK